MQLITEKENTEDILFTECMGCQHAATLLLVVKLRSTK